MYLYIRLFVWAAGCFYFIGNERDGMQETMKQELRKDNIMRYSKVTYSIQWPIHWNKPDESKVITREEAQRKFINGEFYFSVLWSKSGEIVWRC